jgi:hypothetical protein
VNIETRVETEVSDTVLFLILDTPNMETPQRAEDSAHASGSAGNNSGVPDRASKINFVEQGEKLLQNFSKSLQELSRREERFNKMENSIKELTKTINGLKRNNEQGTSTDVHAEKRPRRDSQSTDDEKSVGDDEDQGDELDNLLNDACHSNIDQTERENDLAYDLDQFFETPSVLGPKVKEELAEVLNRALRANPNEEKFAKLTEKHLRPENMDNLQTPKVDTTIWKGLPMEVRSADIQLQKATADMGTCLVPLIRILEATQDQNFNKQTVKELASDAVKMMAHCINANNLKRKTRIKKSLLPQFKPICESTKTSATQLFGDTLKEEIKALNEKPSLITSTGSQGKKPFLGKEGATAFTHPHRNQKKGYGGPHQGRNKHNNRSNTTHYNRQHQANKNFNKNKYGKSRQDH